MVGIFCSVRQSLIKCKVDKVVHDVEILLQMEKSKRHKKAKRRFEIPVVVANKLQNMLTTYYKKMPTCQRLSVSKRLKFISNKPYVVKSSLFQILQCDELLFS